MGVSASVRFSFQTSEPPTRGRWGNKNGDKNMPAIGVLLVDNKVSNTPFTENDMYFRRQLLQGHVHDMGAAMLGGISGNAGLFGSVLDG